MDDDCFSESNFCKIARADSAALTAMSMLDGGDESAAVMDRKDDNEGAARWVEDDDKAEAEEIEDDEKTEPEDDEVEFIIVVKHFV